MKTDPACPFPMLNSLPATLPSEGTLDIELQEGVPILRASFRVRQRIEMLLERHREHGLSENEKKEFDRYEEMDDWLSFLNRVIRNLYQQTWSDDLTYGIQTQNIPGGTAANP